MLRWFLLALMTLPAASAENYCFGFLNSAPDRKEIPQAQVDEIQKGHLAHMNRMGMEGHLLAAGPIVTPGGPRGVVIYRCASIDEARQWTALDPAVQNHRLVLETYRWAGPDGLGEPLITKLKADPATKIEMIRVPLVLFRKTDKWTGAGPHDILVEHFERYQKLKSEGKIRAAGPFMDAEGRPGMLPGVIGIFVFAAMPLEEAVAMAQGDPMVREGYARLESYMWMVAEGVLPQ